MSPFPDDASMSLHLREDIEYRLDKNKKQSDPLTRGRNVFACIYLFPYFHKVLQEFCEAERTLID